MLSCVSSSSLHVSLWLTCPHDVCFDECQPQISEATDFSMALKSQPHCCTTGHRLELFLSCKQLTSLHSSAETAASSLCMLMIPDFGSYAWSFEGKKTVPEVKVPYSLTGILLKLATSFRLMSSYIRAKKSRTFPADWGARLDYGLLTRWHQENEYRGLFIYFCYFLFIYL